MKHRLKSIAGFFLRHRHRITQIFAVAVTAFTHYCRFYRTRRDRQDRPSRSQDPRPLRTFKRLP